MQSVAKFVTKAYPVSGCFDYLSEVCLCSEWVCAAAPAARKGPAEGTVCLQSCIRTVVVVNEIFVVIGKVAPEKNTQPFKNSSQIREEF